MTKHDYLMDIKENQNVMYKQIEYNPTGANDETIFLGVVRSVDYNAREVVIHTQGNEDKWKDGMSLTLFDDEQFEMVFDMGCFIFDLT